MGIGQVEEERGDTQSDSAWREGTGEIVAGVIRVFGDAGAGEVLEVVDVVERTGGGDAGALGG